jgi:hypothetical protein
MVITWDNHRNRVAAPTLANGVRFATNNSLPEFTYFKYRDGPGTRYLVSPSGVCRAVGVDVDPLPQLGVGWH